MAIARVYDMPEMTSSSYAAREEAYDDLVAKGILTPDGRLEMAAHAAAVVVGVQGRPPELAVLMGLNQRIRIADFEPVIGWEGRVLSRAIVDGAHLQDGIERVQGFLKERPGEGTSQERRQAAALIHCVEVLANHFKETQYVLGRIGELRQA